MRLIDADELPEVNTIERIEGDREVFVNSWIPATAIWKAPTVEAIPIEWIEKYNNENWFDAGTQYNAVTCMLDQWREEHESKDM